MSNYMIIFKMVEDHHIPEERIVIEADGAGNAVQKFIHQMQGESYLIIDVMELTW